MPTTIRRVQSSDHAEWLRMRYALWPDQSVDELAEDMLVWLREEQCVAFVSERLGGALCGFLEVAIRACNVNGENGRFGHIEGWYVDPDLRQQGIGKALVEAAEAWVRDQGCHEMWSDARIENVLSHTAHQALGFKESNRLVHFQKRLN